MEAAVNAGGAGGDEQAVDEDGDTTALRDGSRRYGWVGG